MLKTDLDQFPSDKDIETLSISENLKFSSYNFIFINDPDLTQDFSGLIIKEEINTWLPINRNFRMKGWYDLASHTTLDNDFKNPRNCSTFVKHTNSGDIRYIFYNIFVQNLESPSVRGWVGSHIGDYISNPNDKLRKSMMLAKDGGIIRLEITFYRHSTSEKNDK